MANVTQVTLAAGVPTAPSGTVSTLDGVFQTANGPIGIAPANTAPAAGQPAMVVALSPSSVNPNGQATNANGAPVTISSNQTFGGQNQTIPTNQFVAGGQFNTTPTTLTTGNVSPLQLDSAGNQLVNVKTNVGIIPGTTETIATGVTIGTSGVGYLGWLSTIAKLLSNSLTAAVTGAVNLVPATSGGLTETGIVTTAAANVGFVKASPGQLYKVEVTNNSAAWVYVKLYNAASAPTAGAGTPQRRIGIPPSSTLLTTSDIGGVYSTGIAYAITGLAPDTDTTAVAANILVNFHWK